jgi:hypothetical protein
MNDCDQSREIEQTLLDELRQRQTQWIEAADNERGSAHLRFLDALQAFNLFVLGD